MSSGSAENSATTVVLTRQAELDARWEDLARRAAEISPGPSLLDSVLQIAPVKTDGGSRLEEFLREPSPGGALALWFGREWPADRRQLVQKLNRAVAHLDALLTGQVNAILHHPAFQKLEASWRGLHYLVNQVEDERIKVRVLNVSWPDLSRDLSKAIEFDQSQLFKKVYEQEFGMAGGEPFGVLIGDYEIHPRLTSAHHVDDLRTLGAISQVAAAAFAPFIAAAHPSMFGLDQFGGLSHTQNLARTFDQLEYLDWKSFRDTEDARFVGLTLPRVLMRLPYADDGTRVDRFRFREEVEGPDRGKYLWGNAAYAFAAVLVRSFAESGWLASIRGVKRDVEDGGLVAGLPVHSFSTDKAGVMPKFSTDVVITDLQEKEISDEGFIPLCHCTDSEFSAFYSNQSVQKPKKYDDPAATMNARISSMLQYMLCVSRFAHYLKVLARETIGSFAEAAECEAHLQAWIMTYVTGDAEASPDIKARYPLREARVRVREIPGKPGSYQCTAHLWPHFELDELKATVKVTTELSPSRPG